MVSDGCDTLGKKILVTQAQKNSLLKGVKNKKARAAVEQTYCVMSSLEEANYLAESRTLRDQWMEDKLAYSKHMAHQEEAGGVGMWIQTTEC